MAHLENTKKTVETIFNSYAINVLGQFHITFNYTIKRLGWNLPTIV